MDLVHVITLEALMVIIPTTTYTAPRKLYESIWIRRNYSKCAKSKVLLPDKQFRGHNNGQLVGKAKSLPATCGNDGYCCK